VFGVNFSNNNLFPKKMRLPKHMNLLPSPRLAVIISLGTIFSAMQTVNTIDTYGDLPTHRDPDINVETVRLGKGSFPSGGLRILADMEPFQIIDGHVEFNAPPNARDIKVVVAESSRDSLTHAVILNPTRIEVDLRSSEGLFHVDLDEEISGKNPWTGRSDKVDEYDNVFLMNVGRGNSPISFNDQSQATITIVFAS
jgi:hypothetical protein